MHFQRVKYANVKNWWPIIVECVYLRPNGDVNFNIVLWQINKWQKSLLKSVYCWAIKFQYLWKMKYTNRTVFLVVGLGGLDLNAQCLISVPEFRRIVGCNTHPVILPLMWSLFILPWPIIQYAAQPWQREWVRYKKTFNSFGGDTCAIKSSAMLVFPINYTYNVTYTHIWHGSAPPKVTVATLLIRWLHWIVHGISVEVEIPGLCL